MKDLDIRLGDLFRIKKDYLVSNQVPVEEIESNLSVGLLTRLVNPNTEEHKDLLFDNVVWTTDSNLDDIINSKLYKLLFPRIDQYYWFPEYKFFQMFEPITTIKKKEIIFI